MSRCGSCDLYHTKENNYNYDVTCDGNCGVEECASNLQSLVFELRWDLERNRIDKLVKEIEDKYTDLVNSL